MSEAGFTKGPWRTGLSDGWHADGPGNHSCVHVLTGGSTVPIAIVCAEHSQRARCGELVGNADLIAAAPDLFAALEAVQMASREEIEFNAALLLVERALAKALGR